MSSIYHFDGSDREKDGGHGDGGLCGSIQWVGGSGSSNVALT